MVGQRLLLAHVRKLYFERRDVRVERSDDRAAHGSQHVVHVLDHGAAFRTVFEQFLAAQDGVVIFGDLGDDPVVGQRGDHRDQIPRVRRVVEVVADVVGDADLVFDRKPFDLEFAAFGDGSGSLRGDVDHLVALLDPLDFAVHDAQFPPDGQHTLLDKGVRHDRYLPLVGDGVLFVHGDQRVDHVLGTLGHGAVHRDGDDRRLFVGHVALYGGAVGVRRDHRRTLGDGDGPVHVGRVHERRLVYDHLPQRGGDRVAVLGADDPALLLLGEVLVVEVRQLDPAVLEFGHLQRKALVVVVDEIDLDGRAAVEVERPQPVPYGIVDRQVEALHHLRHQPVRLEDVDLVVDVAAVLETYQVAESAQLHVAALAAVLYEDGGRTAVYLRGAGQVVIGHAEADEHRQGEPVPVGQNHL